MPKSQRKTDIRKVVKRMKYRLDKSQTLKFIIISIFLITVISLIFMNFISFRSYQKKGILTIIPFDSLLFLNVGIVLLGISLFSMLQLRQYKIGKLFAVYALLLGLSISLAPCSRFDEFPLSFIRSVFTLGSSILLFQVVGYLTLLKSRKLFQIFRLALICIAFVSLTVQILAFFKTEKLWVYIFADVSVNACIVLSALCSIIVMAVNYKKSNSYTRKQSKILILGIGTGILLYIAMSVLPNIYLVHNGQTEKETFVEISMQPTETMLNSLPLLLFSGVSIAIIFTLLHRAFSVEDMRLKSRWFIIVPLYFGVINVLLFLYANTPIWVLTVTNILLLVPLLAGLWRFFYQKGSTEESAGLKMLHELEKEKQELFAYLHDDVLQSLIAFYRKIQSDKSGRYEDMKQPLSDLIAQIRSVSHNLYPTMVEDLGLEQSLYIFADEIRKAYPAVTISFQYQYKEGILPKAYALAFYRISKELVTNAAKHSGGSEISLLLDEDADGYYIQIADNGKGFHSLGDNALLKSSHMGLYTVKRQIAGLSGRMDIQSAANAGTKYNIYVPKQED